MAAVANLFPPHVFIKLRRSKTIIMEDLDNNDTILLLGPVQITVDRRSPPSLPNFHVTLQCLSMEALIIRACPLNLLSQNLPMTLDIPRMDFMAVCEKPPTHHTIMLPRGRYLHQHMKGHLSVPMLIWINRGKGNACGP